MSRARRAAKPSLGEKVATASARNCRVGPRKVRHVADLLRGLSLAQANRQLAHIHRPSAVPILQRLLKSALNNANQSDEGQRFKPDELIIGGIYVDGARVTTRYQARAMGRAAVIRKRTSHVTVELYKRP